MLDPLKSLAARAARLLNPRWYARRQEDAKRLADAADVLEEHNRWRRGAYDAMPTCPKDLGNALDVAVKALRKQAVGSKT